MCRRVILFKMNEKKTGKLRFVRKGEKGGGKMQDVRGREEGRAKTLAERVRNQLE